MKHKPTTRHDRAAVVSNTINYHVKTTAPLFAIVGGIERI